MGTLTLIVRDQETLRALYERDLSKGRAFVPEGAGVSEREVCELVLLHVDRLHRLKAEVVHVRDQDPGRGVGVALARLDEAGAEALRAFVEAGEKREEDAAVAEAAPDEPEEDPDAPPAHNLQERMAKLSAAEQIKLAAAGTLQERVALERMYGPGVWETLLHNNRLTAPEAARIARKGTLPRPLVELIASNKGWLAVGEVQRALLSNPRSSPTVVLKVLRMLPKPDLLLVPQQTAYPPAVRQAAKNMLGRF